MYQLVHVFSTHPLGNIVLLISLSFLGEHMTEIELVEHLMTLLGYCENPEKEGEYSDDPESALLNELPELISAQEFVEDIAGLST